MTTSPPRVAADVVIDEPLVTELLATQVPEATQFALGQRHEGRDAVVWRLGADWAVRLPRRQLAVDRQVTELDWLPHISAGWGFRAPVPVRVGAPSVRFPWRWSIVPWVPGSPMSEAPLSPHGAMRLGAALASLHQQAPPQAPRHPRRSQTLAAREHRADDRLDTLVRRANVGPWSLNVKAARRIYEQGAHQPRPSATWAHLDIRAEHVMTVHGEFAGLIDWGDAAAGDPAADLGQALVALPQERWDAFIIGYGGIDASTFARARAEAVDFATGLALTGSPHDLYAGWAGLEALGVAHRRG